MMKGIKTMKFNIDNYKGKYAMHCKTEEEAKSFCNCLHNLGREWNNGGSYKHTTEWKVYKSSTVYYFRSDMFGDIEDAKQDGYTILEWSDFMNNTFTKADLKTGDVILHRNGSTRIVIRELNECVGRFIGLSLDDFREDLTTTDKYFDIVAVKRPNKHSECSFDAFKRKFGTLVYDRERDEVEEMTLEQVCKLLGKNIKIIK